MTAACAVCFAIAVVLIAVVVVVRRGGIAWSLVGWLLVRRLLVRSLVLLLLLFLVSELVVLVLVITSGLVEGVVHLGRTLVILSLFLVSKSERIGDSEFPMKNLTEISER